MRIFYCPKHGRVTEAVAGANSIMEGCLQCRAFYYKLARKKAKRTGES